MAEVAAIVLAAGLATRYRAAGGAEPSKLVALRDGQPLVRHVVDAALGSRARPVIVVTGHARADIEAALDRLPAMFVQNDAYASGMASSLRAGMAAVPITCAGAVVLLADMPAVTAALIDRLIAAFDADAGAVVPMHEGRRGNPVLIGRPLFAAVARLSGDEGARRLLMRDDGVREIAVDDPAILFDIDTP